MSEKTLTVMSWNVGRGKNVDEQFNFIIRQSPVPDILLLQDVGINDDQDQKWRDNLDQEGYEFVDTCDWARELGKLNVHPHMDDKIQHENGILTASKREVELHPISLENNHYEEFDFTHFSTVFPEQILITHIASPFGTIKVWNVEVPNGSMWGEEKLNVLETIYDRIRFNKTGVKGKKGSIRMKRILGGDFNLPNSETPDGGVIPNGEVIGGDKKDEQLRERWRMVELKIMEGLKTYGMLDAFRYCKFSDGEQLVKREKEDWKYADDSYSHESNGNRKRLDHLFCDEKFEPQSCKYLLDEGLAYSDHAPIVCTLKARK